MLSPEHDAVFQVWGTSGSGRHDNVIEALKCVSQDVEVNRILSFGCSTGEEAADLARAFSSAQIVGVDIHPHRVKVARKRHGHLGIHFLCAGDPLRDSISPYDLIVAKSVFVRHPEAVGLEDISELMRFDDFDRVLWEVASLLRVGGLLAVYNSNFRVSDGSAMKLLAPVRVNGLHQPSEIPVFGPDGKKLADQFVSEVIFAKVFSG